MNECTAESAAANHSRSLQTIDKWEVEAAWRMEELQLPSLHAARLQLSRLTAELFWVTQTLDLFEGSFDCFPLDL